MPVSGEFSALKHSYIALGRWGTLGKMQLMLRKAAKALYQNDKFTEEEMHNYRMAVTEREVIKFEECLVCFINIIWT